MTFKRLAEYFSSLEKETLRNKMTEDLADLFKQADIDEIDKICYLLQGRVVPLYESLEFGMAEKMVIKAIAQGLGIEEKKVKQVYKKEGDLGSTTAKLKAQPFDFAQGKSSKRKAATDSFKVNEVFEILYKIAKAEGEGSQEEKITLMADLLRKVDPLSSRYIVRIPIGKLRLGFSDKTVLDSLSWMITGSKDLRDEIEKAYLVRPDLGFIACEVKQHGVEKLKKVKPQIGTPILMAKADRLSAASDILDKIGQCAIEFKYDGLRLQAHYNREQGRTSSEVAGWNAVEAMTPRTVVSQSERVKLFSRNLEDVTHMFPDIVQAVKRQIKAKNAIFEGEVVAFNPDTGVFMPFQQTMQRKRKYDIKKTAKEIPVKLFIFELLLVDGENYIGKPYIKRKKKLKDIIREGETIKYAQEKIVEKEEEIEELFEASVEQGFEGIIAKKLDGIYQAGMRGWNWIKFKRAMSKGLADTFDVLVMGYTRGRGKRASFGMGQFLTGVKDEKEDKFVTLSKIGTGLTDEQFGEFKKRVKKLEVKKKPKQYKIDKLLEPDVWLLPGLVVEVAADEITRSQVHTAGRVMGPSKSGSAQAVKTPGYALRFPRLVSFRNDKNPEDTTTVSEVEKMYRQQGRK